MTEETFGPTLHVVKVVDEVEAIRLANDSDYGLSATVWTGDEQRGQRIARQLEVGAVNINDVIANAFSLALPLGGWKHSGGGTRFGGASGMLKYFRQQAITAPRIPTQSKELLWYPVSRRRVKFALGVMRATAARGVPRFGSRNGLHGPRDAHYRRAHRRHDDYRGGGRQVQALAFHPDRPLVASGNEDGTITLIDADTATQTKVQRLFGCTQLAFSTAAAMHAAAMLAAAWDDGSTTSVSPAW